MGTSLPFSLRSILPEHHLITEGGDRLPTFLAPQKVALSTNGNERFIHSFRVALIQRVLRQVHFLITMVVAPCDRFFTDLMQVLIEASVHVEYLCNPVHQGKPAADQPNVPVRLDSLFSARRENAITHTH
jgi:hypothetical protein